MNSKNVQEPLDALVKAIDPEKQIAKLLMVIPTLTDDEIREILLFAKEVISSSQSANSRIQVLRLLRQLMQKPIPCVSTYISKKVLGKLLKNLFTNAETAGFDMWADVFPQKPKGIFELFFNTLQVIETWAEANTTDSRGKYTQFYLVYQDLKNKNFEFPPSFVYQTANESLKEKLKRDLHRCRKLCKELKKAMALYLKKKSKALCEIVDFFQREIEKIIEYFTQRGGKVPEDLIITYSELSESMSLYVAWKNNGYKLEDKGNLLANSCCQVDEIRPKTPPSPDALSKSLELLAMIGESSPLRDERESTYREDIENSVDYYKIKEKLLDSEDLVQMYKSDLEKLQVKYLEVTEHKEELMLRISAILFSNREMNKILNESKRNVEVLTATNFAINEDVEAYKSQNECLKSSIREIQDSLIKLEKECYKNRRYIEHLENGNTALASSNQTLKYELEKARSGEQALNLKLGHAKDGQRVSIPQIFMNQKLLGDTENSYDISIGDSENEKVLFSDEEEKNTTNVSGKLRPLMSNSEELCFNAVPFMEISRPENLANVKATFIGDNLLWYRHFLKGFEGLIFEDDKVQFGMKLEVEGLEVWGMASIANKTLVGLEISLLLISSPEGLGAISLPVGNFHLPPSEIAFFQVYARADFPYFSPPLMKLSYRNTLTEKFIRVPLTFALFCKPLLSLEEVFTSLQENSRKVNIKKLNKSIRNIDDVLKFCSVHTNINSSKIDANSALFGCIYQDFPMAALIYFNPDRSSLIEVRCKDPGLSRMMSETLCVQLEHS